MSVSLEHELIEHLRIPESVKYLREQGFDPQIVSDLDIRGVAQWVLDYTQKYKNPPSETVFSQEWQGFEEAPKPQLEVNYLLDRLRAKHVRNQHRVITEKLIDAVEPEKFIETLTNESYNLWKATASKRFIRSSDDYSDLIEKFKEDAKNPQKGVSFGFEPLDRFTGGAKKGHLSFIAARPKRYKTWMALKAFVEQRRQGFTPVFFTFELSLEEIYQRLMCLISGVSFTDMIQGRLMSMHWKHIDSKMKQFSDLGPAHIVTLPYEDRYVDNMMMEIKRLEGESVIIDQLSYIQPRGRYYKENEGAKEVVHSMKNAATTMEIPWLCLNQINREGANLEEMATADMMGLTRAIEETCDILLGLHRTKDMASRNEVQMGIIEARHCPSTQNFDIKVELTKETKFHMFED